MEGIVRVCSMYVIYNKKWHRTSRWFFAFIMLSTEAAATTPTIPRRDVRPGHQSTCLHIVTYHRRTGMQLHELASLHTKAGSAARQATLNLLKLPLARHVTKITLHEQRPTVSDQHGPCMRKRERMPVRPTRAINLMPGSRPPDMQPVTLASDTRLASPRTNSDLPRSTTNDDSSAATHSLPNQTVRPRLQRPILCLDIPVPRSTG